MQQSRMRGVDLSMNSVPIFVPDVDNWLQPNCNFITVTDLPSYVSFISFAVLMINMRRCRKILVNFLLILVMLSHILLVLFLLRLG